MGFSGDNILTWLIAKSTIMDEFEHVKKRKKKGYHSSKQYDINQIDEQTLQYEAWKLLNEIRTEIRYAESCLDFAEYCMQLDYWDLSDGVEETIYEQDEYALHDQLSDLKQDDEVEHIRQLSITSASSEHSLNQNGKKATRVQSWALSLENLLTDTIGLECFKGFLKKEFSEENLLFWVACEEFKKMKDLTKMRAMAHEIFRKHLSGNAAFLVNVDSVAVKKTESELNAPHAGMFNAPQQQVFQLMKFDSYKRFLKSTAYQDSLLAEEANQLYGYEDETIDSGFRKDPLWTKSMRSPVSESGEKREILQNRERSSSLGAYDEVIQKDISAGINNGYTRKELVKQYDGSQTKSKILRVVLPDETASFMVVESGQTLREGLKELEDQKNIQLQTLDITVGDDRKVANLDADISTLQGNDVYLENKVLLRFDLPNGRSVGVKTNPTKRLRDVLRPVMKTNGYEIENYSIFRVNTKTPLSLDMCALAVKDERLVTKLSDRKKEKRNLETGACKMGRQGFRASFRKFRTRSNTVEEGKEEKMESRKGARKKSDDGAAALMNVLQKCQNSRLNDQRGLITCDIEMPEFLKVSSSTPTPLRSKIFNTDSNNLFQPEPLNSHQDYIDASFNKDLKSRSEFKEKLDRSLSQQLYIRGHASLCAGRSCKELSSLDRPLMESPFKFDYSYSTDKGCTSAGSIDTLSLPVNKNTDLNLSKSDSSLLTQDSLINLSKINCSPKNSRKYKEPKDWKAAPHIYPYNGDTYTFRSRIISSYDEDSWRKNEKTENNKGHKLGGITNGLDSGGRPLPILSNINDFDIHDDIKPTRKKNTYARKDTVMDTRADSGIDTNPSSSEMNLNNIHTNDPKSNSTRLNTEKFVTGVDARKTQSSEMIDSIDIVNYDLSPRALERCKKMVLSDDMLAIDRENTFETNRVPTPEKRKLMKGETIRGRQNEKITFV